jgi:hypothetical protein
MNQSLELCLCLQIIKNNVCDDVKHISKHYMLFRSSNHRYISEK